MVQYTKLKNIEEAERRDSDDKRRSTLIEEIPPSIKRLFDAVAKGKLDEVKKMITKTNVDINHLDSMGNSALHIALSKNQEDMVKLLLDNGIDVFDCLFHAIKLNQLNNVELIMDTLSNVDRRYSFMGCHDSTDFPHYMTPLMCASQCGHVEIMDYLVNIGHPMIPIPHEPRCLCETCIEELDEKDPLELAHKNLEVYKALCSPAYILKYSSEDPILMVFYRVHELKLMANANRVFIRKYQELIETTEQIAAQLVSLCRTSDEVRIVLSVKEGSALMGKFLFPRLILALDYKQRHFVSQVNVQAVLEYAWHEDWYEWKSYSNFRCLLHIFGRIMMLPVLLVSCLFLPSSALATFYSIPVNRFISSVATNIVFLFLLYQESDRDKTEQKRYDILNNKFYKLAIVVYVVSHIFSSFRMWMFRGSERFFTFAWNWYDLATQSLFLLTFAFWAIAFITVNWQPDIERKYWDYLDSQLVAEACFCVGTVMAYMKLLFYIQIDSALGPMQVSIGKMTTDFSHFVIIFAIVIGSFTAAMCHLYEYYDGMKQVDPESQAEATQESSFVSPYETFKVLFWGLFGMSSQETGTVVIENIPLESSDLESINTHDFTQAVGTTLFSAYIVLTVIVLLNMLIAAISNTFQNVSENVDYEWIFGRSKVYLIYMAQTVIPPPLSILPACVGESAVNAFFNKVFSFKANEEYLQDSNAVGRKVKEKKIKEGKVVEETTNKESIVEPEKELSIEKAYELLLPQLIQRYFSLIEEDSDTNDGETI